MDLWYALMLMIVFASVSSSCGEGHEDLLLSLACPSETECGQHVLNCHPDGVIRIKGAIHGFKSPEAQAHCQTTSRDLCLAKRDPCCKFSNSSDCLQLSPKAGLEVLYGTCEGRSQCVFRSQHVQSGLCNVTQGYAPFSAIAYACVNRSVLLNPVEARYLVGQEVHLYYPGRVQSQPTPDIAPRRPKPAGQSPTTIRSPFTNLSELLKAEKFRLNQIFGVQGTDGELLAVLRAMVAANGKDQDGVVLSSELVHQDGGEIELGTVDDDNEIDLDSETDLDSKVDFDGEVALERKKGETVTESTIVLERLQGALLSSMSHADTLKEIEDLDKQKQQPKSLSPANKTSYLETSNNISSGFYPGIFTNISFSNFNSSDVENLDTVLNQSAEKLDAVLDQSTTKLDAILNHSAKKLDAVLDHSAKKLDAVMDRSGALFHPGEGYQCRVTGLSVTGEERPPREEVAVSVMYLRLVGTRGCTKVSLLDTTQRTNFRCTRDKVTKLAGRQLKTMVTPLNIHLKLGASIWEDDFIWIKFTSVTGGPLSLHCQEGSSLSDDTTEDETNVDWYVVFAGLSVTGAMFFLFFIAVVVYIIHRSRGTFIVSRKRGVKRRAGQGTRWQAGHPPTIIHTTPSHPHYIPPSSSTNNHSTASSPSSSPASSTSLSLSNLKLPPLPALSPMPDVTRRSFPAMPTRPAPSPNRHVVCSAALSLESIMSSGWGDDRSPQDEAPTLRAAECYLQAASMIGLPRSVLSTDIERCVLSTDTDRPALSAKTAPQNTEDSSGKGDHRSSRGKGSAACQVVDRHSQMSGHTWQSYDHPPQPSRRASSVDHQSKALSHFSTYSPFQQVSDIMITDLDADSDPDVAGKSAQCTAEEDGDSVDSTFFDYDSFAAGDLSEAEMEGMYDRLHSHSSKSSFKIAGETDYYDHTK